MADDEKIPERVRRAEARRAFRLLLARGSLGCPQPLGEQCGRLLSEHPCDGWDRWGRPVNPRCPS